MHKIGPLKIIFFIIYPVLLYLLVQQLWEESKGEYDQFNRLIVYEDKQEIACPEQTKNTGVVLALGQSNSANYGSAKFSTAYPDQVLNYFYGKCYVAASPLLGASGIGGEFITPLADELIKNGLYNSIIIISSGIEGSQISLWRKGGILNNMLQDVLKNPLIKYKVTDIVWHQGEKDFILATEPEKYKDSFNSLLDSLETINVKAPIFISVSTKCSLFSYWNSTNPIAEVQKNMPDNKKIFLGANTDDLLQSSDRRDFCHFGKTGQLKTAHAYAESIKKYHKEN